MSRVREEAGFSAGFWGVIGCILAESSPHGWLHLPPMNTDILRNSCAGVTQAHPRVIFGTAPIEQLLPWFTDTAAQSVSAAHPRVYSESVTAGFASWCSHFHTCISCTGAPSWGAARVALLSHGVRGKTGHQPLQKLGTRSWEQKLGTLWSFVETPGYLGMDSLMPRTQVSPFLSLSIQCSRNCSGASRSGRFSVWTAGTTGAWGHFTATSWLAFLLHWPWLTWSCEWRVGPGARYCA